MKHLILAVGGVLAIGWGSGEVRAQAPDGQALYRQHCRACHGARGTPSRDMRSMFKNLPVLADSAFLAGRSQDSIVAVLERGLKVMQSFKGTLSGAEMVAVASHLRTLPGAPP